MRLLAGIVLTGSVIHVAEHVRNHIASDPKAALRSPT